MNFLQSDLELSRHSYYAATTQRTAPQPTLQERLQCDVAVVGGGLAGLCAALDLAEQGLQVVLLEAKEVSWGASGRNGGQLIHGLACDVAEIESQLGLADARRVWDMSIEALDLVRQRCEQHHIDCDLQDGFIGVATSPRKSRALSQWADRIERLYGYEMPRIAPQAMRSWVNSPRYDSGIYDPRSGHLHPLKYALGLAHAAKAAGVRIHEHSPVLRIERGATVTLHTAQGQVSARQALLAGNVYLQGVAPQLEPRIMPVGTYIIASAPMGEARANALIPSRAAVCDTNFVLDYLRLTADHRLLFGGEVSYSTRTPDDLAETMRRRMVMTFPQLGDLPVEFAWGGFVDITMNRAPDFGRLDSNLYYLQGFSGHGLALTGLAGRIVAQAMAGDEGRFDLFSRLRHRRFPGGRLLRTPALVLGMAWYRLLDLLCASS
jgi:gamma-glutamylputrescine oxidase